MSRLRLQSHQGADGRGCAVLGALLHQSSCEYEGDDHHGGVEPRMPFDASCAPYRFAPERVEGAEEKRDACREGHEGVHIGRQVDELFPGCCVELSSAVDEVGQRDDEHRLVLRIL